MEIFPTQYSTLSATALNTALGLVYGLKGTTCRLLIRNVSDTYILENDASKYIFKIYRDVHRSLEEIKGELALLNILQEQCGNVAYPIKDLEGREIQQFRAAEGLRNGVLFSFAKGEVAYELSDEQLALLGREMAKIHHVTASLELPFHRREYSIQTTLLDPIKIIEPAFRNLPDEYAALKAMVLAVADEMSGIDMTDFSYGYCHYDFLPKNFHFDGDRLTFFDFDFAGKGYLVNDIASFLVYYFIEQMNGKLSAAEVKRCFLVFVQHYKEYRALSDAELKHLKLFGFAFWMFYFQFHFEHFDDWSNIFFNDRFIKGRIALLKQWIDWDFSL